MKRRAVGKRASLLVAMSFAALAVAAPLAVDASGGGQASVANRAAFKPKGGVWRGTTTQGFPVRFQVKLRSVGKAVFTVDTGACEISYPRGIRDWDNLDGTRSFFLSGGGSDFFDGTFINRSRARGSAQASNFDVGCGGKFVHWRAHWAP